MLYNSREVAVREIRGQFCFLDRFKESRIFLMMRFDELVLELVRCYVRSAREWALTEKMAQRWCRQGRKKIGI
jgi:hypothetical protein